MASDWGKFVSHSCGDSMQKARIILALTGNASQPATLTRSFVYLTALALAVVGLCLTGCRFLPRPTDTVPAELISRRWVEPNNPESNYTQDVPIVIDELAAAFRSNTLPVEPTTPNRPLNILALSAGGKYGAYSAGVLCSWTRSGTRPQFDVVTGVSAGVILAIYSFLGPQYDPALEKFFTQTDDRDLYRYRYVRNILIHSSLATPDGMERILEAELNPRVMDEIRQAHRDGRRLFVATLNQRSKRLCVWDIGAIACSGRPDADFLVRKVVLAAVAVPGLVPPVEFEVEVDGKRYVEVHADGGTATQAFFRLPGYIQAVRGTKWLSGSNLYVISAGKLYADPAPNRLTLPTRLGSTLSTALYALYRAELFRLYTICQVTGMNYHLVVLPSEFRGDPSSFRIDSDEMTRLFRIGVGNCKDGIPWRNFPPGALPEDEELPRGGTQFLSIPAVPESGR